MSRFTSAIAWAWSGVSTYSKASSNSFCHGRVLRERESVGEAAAGVELQELLGHVAHGLADGRLPPRPARAAEPVEHGLDALDARVLLHEVEALDRQEQRLLVGVPDLHELALLALDRNALEAAGRARCRSRCARRASPSFRSRRSERNASEGLRRARPPSAAPRRRSPLRRRGRAAARGGGSPPRSPREPR